MNEEDRLSIMAAIIAGARMDRFDRGVADEAIAADAVRIARAIDTKVRAKDDGKGGGEVPLFKHA